jgi:hypothetical protein
LLRSNNNIVAFSASLGWQFAVQDALHNSELSSTSPNSCHVSSDSRILIADMLDPVSAVGVASAVVQFVDFSSKLISGTIKIYRVKQENRKDDEDYDDLQDLTESLVNINSRIQDSLSTVQGKSLSTQDQEIARLCRECNQVANELLTGLKRLKSSSKSQFWASFVQALKTVWSESEIESLGKTLDSFRSQISMHTLVSMRYAREITILIINC